MVFNAQKIVHTLPQLSVVNADTSTIPITYPQIKQSLGIDIYNVEKFYIYSDSLPQLQGQIQYSRFDANGKQDIKSLITYVNPYQNVNAILREVDQKGTLFILNGNSNFSSTILPNSYVQVKLFSKRLTNSLVRATNNFDILERIFRLGGFAEPPKKIEEEPKDKVVDNLRVVAKKEKKFDDIIVNSIISISAAAVIVIVLKKVLDVREH